MIADIMTTDKYGLKSQLVTFAEPIYDLASGITVEARSMQIHWMHHVLTRPAIPHLPRIRRLGYETVRETSYVRACGGHRASSHTPDHLDRIRCRRHQG